MDAPDIKIVTALQTNARISIRDLAEIVGMSPPSVTERVRRLEADGVIKAFTIDLDAKALGFALQAIVRVRPLPGQLHTVRRLIEETPQIIECDKVTGDDCFIARLCLRSIEELDGLLERIVEKAETNTSIIKSTPVTRRLPPFSK